MGKKNKKKRQQDKGTPSRPEVGAEGSRPAEAPQARGVAAAIGLGLVVVTLVAYARVHGYDFVNFDDPAYVYENPQVEEGLTAAGIGWALTTGDVSNWHPLTWLSLMLDVSLFGVNPGGHHMVNVLFHAVNTLLLFLVLWRMTAGRRGREAVWASGMVAALFALHPLHVESVAWISERKDVLSTLFWMLTMAAYVHYVRKPSVLRYAWVAGAFALGLLAKPMLVTLPAVLLLMDYWPLGRMNLSGQPVKEVAGRFGRLALEKAPLLGVTVLSSIATMLAQGRAGGVVPFDVIPFGYRLGNALVAYVAYMAKMFWPGGLSIFYPHLREALPLWQPALAVLVLVALTLAVLTQVRRRPYLPVGWFWYVGTLVPVIGIVQVGDQAMADRYTYIPLIGLFVMLVWGGAELIRERNIPKAAAGVLCAAVLVACGVGTVHQVGFWKDTVTLFEHAAAVTDGNYLAHKALGAAYNDEVGDHAKAAEHCRKAIELDPHDADLYYNLGNALMKLGQVDEAIAGYTRAIELEPEYVNAHYNLGNAYVQKQAFEEALAAFERTAELDPGYLAALRNAGSALAWLKRYDEAAERYQEVLRRDPRDWETWCNLGSVTSRAGDLDAAVNAYKKALGIDPQCERARKALDQIEAAKAGQ